MRRFVVAIVAAIVGGLLMGVLLAFISGFVPDDGTRWAFFVMFGIPIWIVLEIFSDAIAALMLPAVVATWARAPRMTYVVVLWSLFLGFAWTTTLRYTY